MRRLHLVVRGRVQGVWYRASTRNQARSLGLVGRVRNLEDGRVEAVAEGPPEVLEALVAWARRGPPAARVDELAVEWGEPRGEYPDFDVAPTADRAGWSA